MSEPREVVEQAMNELEPLTITLNGQEQMRLCVNALYELSGGDKDIVKLTFELLAEAHRDRGMDHDTAVRFVLGIIAEAGKEVPQFLHPTMVHVMKKIYEIKDHHDDR